MKAMGLGVRSACVLLAAAGVASARADKPGQSQMPVAADAAAQIQVVRSGNPFAIDAAPRFTVTTRGRVLNQPVWGPMADGEPLHPAPASEPVRPESTDERGNCDFTETYSGANFSNGGSLIAQAGMAEGESAAVQFVIPASHFPVRIRLSEILWATQNATVQTTTGYAVSWYSGNPATGAFIDGYVADGVILPYIQLPIGSSAVNVQVTVDPQDPQQIVIPAPLDGSNSFTVEFRISEHNAPSPNGCTVPTPIASNAFPTTDTNGLSQPSRNWLFGLNCGLFGCPANGGWATFADLPGFCRPSGDWNIRVTYERVNCGPATGACCFTSGACTDDQTTTTCQQAGGTYRGDNTTCATQTCPVSTQACCFSSSQSCIDLTPANCTGFGGTLGGAGTSCATYVCFPIGACCLPNGTCVDAVSPATCSSQGGQFRGNATTCATQNCPPPVGACCSPAGFCAEFTQANCNAVGGTWKGAGTSCIDGNSNGTADACETQAPCPGDFNNDRVRNTADLSIFLGRFGQNVTPGSTGDLNADGLVNTPDLTIFLGVFGVPCP